MAEKNYKFEKISDALNERKTDIMSATQKFREMIEYCLLNAILKFPISSDATELKIHIVALRNMADSRTGQEPADFADASVEVELVVDDGTFMKTLSSTLDGVFLIDCSGTPYLRVFASREDLQNKKFYLSTEYYRVLLEEVMDVKYTFSI